MQLFVTRKTPELPMENYLNVGPIEKLENHLLPLGSFLSPRYKKLLGGHLSLFRANSLENIATPKHRSQIICNGWRSFSRSDLFPRHSLYSATLPVRTGCHRIARNCRLLLA